MMREREALLRGVIHGWELTNDLLKNQPVGMGHATALQDIVEKLGGPVELERKIEAEGKAKHVSINADASFLNRVRYMRWALSVTWTLAKGAFRKGGKVTFVEYEPPGAS